MSTKDSQVLRQQTHNKAILDAIQQVLMKANFSTEGIFRLAGSETTRQQCVDELLDPFTDNQIALKASNNDSVLMAVILKQLLRDRELSSNRLFSKEIIEQFNKARDSSSPAERIKAIGKSLQCLSDTDKIILNGLLDIADKVAAQSDSNKMTPSNIATAIGPSLFEEEPLAISGPDTNPMAAIAHAKARAEQTQKLNSDFAFIIQNRAEFNKYLKVDNAQELTTNLNESVQSIQTQGLELMTRLQATIENTDWKLGYGGGIKITLADGLTQKTVPHNVAKLYETCRSIDNTSLSDSIKQAQDIIENRNSSQGGWSTLKSILKTFDILNLFSRDNSTESFYKQTQEKFAQLKNTYQENKAPELSATIESDEDITLKIS